MYVLATLYALRQYLGLDDADTSEDARLIEALLAASATIEQRTRRTFQPRLATIAHDVNLRDVRELLLKDDLQTLAQISHGDDVLIPLADVMQVSEGILRLTNGNAFSNDASPVAAIQVTGIWGYHPNGSSAWVDSDDSIQDASISATVTTITVNDADAGTTPRFQVGQLLRLEEEYVHITAVDVDSNQLTIKRGVQGTVASNHANNTAIEIYQMPVNVAQLTLRWALWLYREPDNFDTSVPSVLLDSLRGLRRLRLYS